jgi:hypothetical protein
MQLFADLQGLQATVNRVDGAASEAKTYQVRTAHRRPTGKFAHMATRRRLTSLCMIVDASTERTAVDACPARRAGGRGGAAERAVRATQGILRQKNWWVRPSSTREPSAELPQKCFCMLHRGAGEVDRVQGRRQRNVWREVLAERDDGAPTRGAVPPVPCCVVCLRLRPEACGIRSVRVCLPTASGARCRRNWQTRRTRRWDTAAMTRVPVDVTPSPSDVLSRHSL